MTVKKQSSTKKQISKRLEISFPFPKNFKMWGKINSTFWYFFIAKSTQFQLLKLVQIFYFSIQLKNLFFNLWENQKASYFEIRVEIYAGRHFFWQAKEKSQKNKICFSAPKKSTEKQEINKSDLTSWRLEWFNGASALVLVLQDLREQKSRCKRTNFQALGNLDYIWKAKKCAACKHFLLFKYALNWGACACFFCVNRVCATL